MTTHNFPDSPKGFVTVSEVLSIETVERVGARQFLLKGTALAVLWIGLIRVVYLDADLYLDTIRLNTLMLKAKLPRKGEYIADWAGRGDTTYITVESRRASDARYFVDHGRIHYLSIFETPPGQIQTFGDRFDVIPSHLL